MSQTKNLLVVDIAAEIINFTACFVFCIFNVIFSDCFNPLLRMGL